MFKNKISKIVKRDGRIADFDKHKIASAISKAAIAAEENPTIGSRLSEKIERILFLRYRGKLPTVENVQDVVEEILINSGYSNIAKAYILYREKRQEIRSAKEFYGVKSDELKLSVNAVKVLQSRYLLRNSEGKVVETPKEMFRRVARAIAAVDKKYNGNYRKTEEEFFDAMSKFEFLPNTPCLMNAGTEMQMLNACFVLNVEDSLDKIFDSLKTAGILQKYAGGTGFSFSKLRPKGSVIKTTKGVSSGPVSFMSLFDAMTGVIKLGSKRRGANMGILRVDHPDVIDFIQCKGDLKSFSNFNISVAATDRFMNAVLKNKNYDLIDPATNKKVKSLNARAVFDLIVMSAWNSGDPGLIFIDRINRLHPLHEKIEATNPCGEQPLLSNESCVLGSINLSKFVAGKKIEWGRLKKTVFLGIHFLDNVVDANNYITKEIEDVTKGNRKIGLGVMGWADMIYQLEIPYNSNSALRLAEKIMKFISKNSRDASEELGRKRENFPDFSRSKLKKHYKNMRNATVTTIAPTGTISLISGCSSGIEPVFALSYVREILEGTFLLETNKYFEEAARKLGFFNKNLANEISKTGSLKDIKHIPADAKKVFVTAFDIEPEWHVKMQAAFQKYTDNAVSKTVNLSENAARENVRKIYLLAYELGCKGITVFRTGSKEGRQVLYSGEDYEKRIKLNSEFAGGCPDLDCGH